MDKSASMTVVRPLERRDAEAVLAWRNHVDVRNFMYTSHEITADEHAAWMDNALTDAGYHVRIVESQAQPIGVVTFKHAYDDRVAEWGFYVVPGSPKGTGMQMGRAAITHAFSELNFRKICGQALGFNSRSREFHLRLGFVEEGCLRAQFAGNGDVHDIIVFGLLKTEFI